MLARLAQWFRERHKNAVARSIRDQVRDEIRMKKMMKTKYVVDPDRDTTVETTPDARRKRDRFEGLDL